MSALAANRDTKTRGLTLWDIEEAAAVDILYGGAAACINAAGYLAPVTGASGDVFCGVVQEKCDNSGGSAGDLKAKVQMPMMALWAASGLAQSDVGGDCWFADDQTITTTPGNCYAGKIYAPYGTTGAWVNHLPAARTCDSWALADDAYAVFGTGSDITMRWNGSKFLIEQAAGNSAIELGVDGAGIDLKLFGDTASSYALWDQSGDKLIFDGADLRLQDADLLSFGDADDITINWNGTKLVVAQAAADSAIELGVDGAGIDLKLFGDTASSFALWDQSADKLIFDGADIRLQDADILNFGDADDIAITWNATQLVVSQAAPNSAIYFGVDGAGIDLKLFGDTASSFALWDQSADKLIFDGADIRLQDADILNFGDADDIAITWNGTNLVILPAADNTGQILIGDGTTDIDLKVFMNTSGKFVLFDVSEAILQLDDVDILLGDNDVLKFGDGSDVTITWNGAQLIVTGLPTSDPTVANALYTSSLALKLSAGA